MRLFEALLAVSELLAYSIILVPRLRRLPYAIHSLLAPLLLALIQVIAEGMRWQMVPAYALSIIFAALYGVVCLRRSSTHRRIKQPRWQRIAIIAGVGLAGVVQIIAVALPAMLPVFSFPQPTGPYGIGTTIYHWVDTSRPEIFTADPADHRELMAQVWYPAAKNQTSQRDPYLHNANLAEATKLGHLPGFFLSHLKYVMTNAQPSVPVANTQKTYPVIVFSPGRGGYRSNTNFQVEELVSQGYIVVGIDQPYTVGDVAFPDGRHTALDPRVLGINDLNKTDPFKLAVYDQLGQDAIFTLNKLSGLNTADPEKILTGHLDLARAGILGSSLGGITVAEACHMDLRFAACLGVDVEIPADVITDGLKQPTMWIIRGGTSDRTDEGFNPRDTAEENISVRSLISRKPQNGYLVSIPSMYHSDICDFSNLMAPPFVARLAGLTGPGDWHQTHNAINAYSVAFFDTYLKGKSSSALKGTLGQYPQATLEVHPH